MLWADTMSDLILFENRVTYPFLHYFIDLYYTCCYGKGRKNDLPHVTSKLGMVGRCKLPVQRRSTNLDNSRARAYCAYSRLSVFVCVWGGARLFLTFLLLSIISLFFLPLWETTRYRLKYCLKGPLNPKHPTIQPINYF